MTGALPHAPPPSFACVSLARRPHARRQPPPPPEALAGGGTGDVINGGGGKDWGSGGGGGGGGAGKGGGKDGRSDGGGGWGWKGWQDRVAYDPEFPFKVFLEQVSVCCVLCVVCVCVRALCVWYHPPTHPHKHMKQHHNKKRSLASARRCSAT